MAKDKWGRDIPQKKDDGGFIVKSGGSILRWVAISLTIPLFLLFAFLNNDLYEKMNDQVIDRITEILTPEGATLSVVNQVANAVDSFFSETTLGGIVIHPIWGSLILAFVFGMIFSLALKTNQAMPVWIIAFLVVIIAMVAGMGSWAIPVTLVYISEAILHGEYIVPVILLFWIMIASAFIIGFGANWYVAKAANIAAGTMRGGKHSKRTRSSVKMKFNKRGKK